MKIVQWHILHTGNLKPIYFTALVVLWFCVGIRCEKYVHFLFIIWVILPSNLLLLGYPSYRPMVGYYALAWLCKRKRIAIPLNIDTPAFCDCDPFVCIYKLPFLKKLHIFLHTMFPFTCSKLDQIPSFTSTIVCITICM